MDAVSAGVAALTLLLLALSVNVSRLRRQARSDRSVPKHDLAKAIRAQGNAAEYIPVIVAILLYLQLAATSARPMLIGVAILAVLSRLAHATGLLRARNAKSAHPLRFFGALGTYACLLALSGLLLIHGGAHP